MYIDIKIGNFNTKKNDSRRRSPHPGSGCYTLNLEHARTCGADRKITGNCTCPACAPAAASEGCCQRWSAEGNGVADDSKLQLLALYSRFHGLFVGDMSMRVLLPGDTRRCPGRLQLVFVVTIHRTRQLLFRNGPTEEDYIPAVRQDPRIKPLLAKLSQCREYKKKNTLRMSLLRLTTIALIFNVACSSCLFCNPSNRLAGWFLSFRSQYSQVNRLQKHFR